MNFALINIHPLGENVYFSTDEKTDVFFRQHLEVKTMARIYHQT